MYTCISCIYSKDAGSQIYIYNNMLCHALSAILAKRMRQGTLQKTKSTDSLPSKRKFVCAIKMKRGLEK